MKRRAVLPRIGATVAQEVGFLSPGDRLGLEQATNSLLGKKDDEASAFHAIRGDLDAAICSRSVSL